MKIDWKRKLTSRKFWAAIAGFVTMLLVYFGKDAGSAEQVAALIMAGASVVAYIIGEGLADGAETHVLCGDIAPLDLTKTEETDDGE